LGGNYDIVVDDGSTVSGYYVLSTGTYGLSGLEYGCIMLFRNVDKYSRVHKF